MSKTKDHFTEKKRIVIIYQITKKLILYNLLNLNQTLIHQLERKLKNQNMHGKRVNLMTVLQMISLVSKMYKKYLHSPM